MEYMDRGSLADILSPDYPLPEPLIAYVCRCLLLALDALHSKNRIHRGTLFLFSSIQTSKAVTFSWTRKDTSNSPTSDSPSISSKTFFFSLLSIPGRTASLHRRHSLLDGSRADSRQRIRSGRRCVECRHYCSRNGPGRTALLPRTRAKSALSHL